jgi:hypothetical protein
MPRIRPLRNPPKAPTLHFCACCADKLEQITQLLPPGYCANCGRRETRSDPVYVAATSPDLPGRFAIHLKCESPWFASGDAFHTLPAATIARPVHARGTQATTAEGAEGGRAGGHIVVHAAGRCGVGERVCQNERPEILDRNQPRIVRDGAVPDEEPQGDADADIPHRLPHDRRSAARAACLSDGSINGGAPLRGWARCSR